jgi:hypothetical protein
VSGQLNAPADLNPVKRRLEGPQSQSGRYGAEKNFQTLPGFEPPTVHPVASRYTGCETFEVLSILIKYAVVI